MMIKEHFVRLFKPEDIPAVTRKLNEAQNFFKHADGDSSETLAFRPSQTEMLLLDACLKYRELSGELVPAFGVYQAWFMIAVGRALILPSHLAQIRQDAQRAFPKGRQAFFAECLPLANDLGLPNLNNG